MNETGYRSLLGCNNIGTYFDNSTSFRINILIVGILDMLSAIQTIVFNGVIVTVFLRKKRLMSGSNKLLFSLSISDLISGLFVQPFLAISMFVSISRGASNIPCVPLKISGVVGTTVACVSLLTVSLISLERFVAIFHPFIHLRLITSRMLTLTCIGLWVTCTVAVTIFLSSRNFFIAFFWTNAILIGFTYVFNTYIYVRISRQVHKIRKEMTQLKLRLAKIAGVNPYTQSESNSKATQIAASIIMALLFCYLPQVILSLTNVLTTHITFVNVYLEHWAMTFALFSSGLNPIFYYYYNTEIRREVCSLLRISRGQVDCHNETLCSSNKPAVVESKNKNDEALVPNTPAVVECKYKNGEALVVPERHKKQSFIELN